MGECEHLLRERLQAITEKHWIQEDIRQKKVELDQEKLQLQHLKKKVLREQWLLQDSTSHNAPYSKQQQNLLCDQQRTRALQLSIHSIEMEVESLERVESLISTNESFILDRLKTVEKSPEEIIKEAQSSFVPNQSQVTMVIPDFPTFLSPTGDVRSQPNGPDQTDVLLEDAEHHAGLEVFVDGRKCAYALRSHQESHDHSAGPELSGHEVDELLKCARVNYHQVNERSTSRGGDHCFYKNQDERVRGHQGRVYGELRNMAADPEFSYGDHCQRKPPPQYQDNVPCWPESRHSQCQQLGNSRAYRYGNHRDIPYGALPVGSSSNVVSSGAAGHCTVRAGVNGSRVAGVPSPRSQQQKVVTASQPQLCYTPAHHIPLCDYVSVDDEQLYCLSPPLRPNQYAPPYAGFTHCDRAPSPLYHDDPPYTLLNDLETSEPITAIFLGFQTSQDDSGQLQELHGSLRAELVTIEDAHHSGMPEKNCYSQVPAANGKGVRGRQTEKRVEAGVQKIHRKQKACCSVC